VPQLPSAAGGDLLDLRPEHTVRHLPRHRPTLVPGLPAAVGGMLGMRPPESDRLRHPDHPALRRLHRPRTLARLPTCSDPDHPNPGQCARCLINRRLEELMGPATDALPPGLHALRRDIATTEHPITAMRWLTKPSIAPVLSDLAAGRIRLTHEALDELPNSQPIAHLRQTLVAVGALPDRDELIVRLEAFLADLLACQHDPQRRRLLHQYLIWHLVRRLRGRNNGRPTTRPQSLMIRRLARGAVAFLDWLAAHDLTLESCQQADLDRWSTDESATYRQEAGRLIRWAHTNKLTTTHLASTKWNGPAQLLDHQHRWDTTRRLLHNDDLKPEDRLAGLLVLLYAQGATAISRMTLEQIHVDENDVRLRLGRVPIQLPEPVATLARAVVSNRKGHATIGALTPSPWLLPGGQPGRPISSAQLTHRLNNLGIRPSQARSTALFQLATEIPAAILARTLGIHTDVAVTWQRHSQATGPPTPPTSAAETPGIPTVPISDVTISDDELYNQTRLGTTNASPATPAYSSAEVTTGQPPRPASGSRRPRGRSRWR
jgi:hypothetical protein